MIKTKDGTSIPTETDEQQAALIGGVVLYENFAPEYGLLKSFVKGGKFAFVRFNWGTTAARVQLSQLTLMVPPESYFEGES